MGVSGIQTPEQMRTLQPNTSTSIQVLLKPYSTGRSSYQAAPCFLYGIIYLKRTAQRYNRPAQKDTHLQNMWLNLLSPHVCRRGGCEVVEPGNGADGPSARRRHPNFGVSHSLGISPQDMLEAVLEAEEEERHLRRLNTHNASDSPAVADRRVQTARDAQRVLDADQAQNEADSLLWEEGMQAQEAVQTRKRKQMREEDEAAKVAAALYRDWEQWEVMHTPPSGPRTRTSATYKVEAAVFVDGKQAAKKARWLVDMRRDAKVGMHFTVEPHDGALPGTDNGGELSGTARSSTEPQPDRRLLRQRDDVVDQGLSDTTSAAARSARPELQVEVPRHPVPEAADRIVQHAARLHDQAQVSVATAAVGGDAVETVIDVDHTPLL